jgi:hypothetical protein
VPIALDFWLFEAAFVRRRALAGAGLVVEARLERAPYAEVEYPSQRAYLLARRPGAVARPDRADGRYRHLPVARIWISTGVDKHLTRRSDPSNERGTLMAQSTTAVVIASAGTLSMLPGTSVPFTVTWGNHISPFRWSRIWPTISGAADEASHQTVTVVSEGSQWDTPASYAIAATIRGAGDLGAPVVARIQVMSSQEDTF